MSRRAILIDGSAVPGQSSLPGAKVDTELFQRFLLSDAGGAWQATEIEVLRNPRVLDVEIALKKAASASYSFVTFSGHGHHVVGRQLNETRVLVRDGEIPAYKLNPGNRRCTIVIDACRNVTHIVEQMRTLAANMLSFNLKAQMPGYRIAFDNAVSRCEEGVIFMYSCDKNQAAQESTDGGYFSAFFVNSAEEWHKARARNLSTGINILDVQSTFTVAAKAVTERVPQQKPQYEGGRRIKAFPFAVHIG